MFAKRSMYIVLEGVVGTGKSTQSKLLLEVLKKKYPDREIVLTREPGGTPIAEAIRTLVQAIDFPEEMHALTDAYLYAAARAQLIHTTIKDTIDAGGIVISDRNVCSSLAYQGHTQGLGIDRVWKINEEAVKAHLPDIILFMDLDVATGLSRTFDTDGDKRERNTQDFFDRVYAGYQELFDFSPLNGRMHRIDALGTIEEIHERILKELDI